MKSLIIGAQGLVGSALAKQLPDALLGIPMEPTKKNQVYTDLLRYESLLKVFDQHRPDVVYLPAYITNVDKCEDFGTNSVNIRGAITVLRLCEQFNSKFVFFSSSYVFDGQEKEPYRVQHETCPIQNYGIQKETVERAALKSDAKMLIVRTVGVFGEERRKKNFAKQVISAVFAGRQVFSPTDQFMNPVLSTDLAKTTIRLAEKHNGLYHVAGDECVSKFEFAKRVARYFHLENLVVGVSTEEMKQRAPRPKMGGLNCNTLVDVGMKIPSFQGGLLHFLEMNYNG
jgi:dTDP-4-dehydrorhamnose reductase